MTFDDFWALYPRKQNKGAARKAYAKLDMNEVLFTDIAMNLSERTKPGGEWFDMDKKFIPHASTYLNNERWDDEVIIKPLSTSTRDCSLLEDLTDTSWAGGPPLIQ